MSKQKVCFLLIGLICAAVFVVIVVTASQRGLLAGKYIYDPRHETPSRWLVVNRPEEALMDVLHRQIAKDGTYPPHATRKLVNIEPTKVTLSIISDWAMFADVDVNLVYDDGSTHNQTFRFRDVSSHNIMPVIDISVEATWHLLRCGLHLHPDGYSFCEAG